MYKRLKKGGKGFLYLFCIFFILGFSTTAVEAKTVLKVTIVEYNVECKKLFDEWFSLFEKQNPEVRIEIDFTNWQAYEEKILTAVAGGVAPDVFQMGSEWIMDFAPIGALYPLDKYVEDWEDWSDFFKLSRGDVEWKGHIYAVPYLVAGRAIYYRKDFFRNAGLDPNLPPDTWQEIAEYAEKITKRDVKGNIILGGYSQQSGIGGVQEFTHYLYQAGGKIFTTDELTEETQPAMNSLSGILALQFLSYLINDLKVGHPGGMPAEAGINPLVTGSAAMAYSNSTVLPMAEKYGPEISNEIGVGYSPKMLPFTQRAQHVYLNKYSIYSGSKNVDLAWQLIKFLSTVDRQADYMMGYGAIPPRKTAVVKLWEKDFRYKKAWDNVLEHGRIWQKIPSLWPMIYDQLLPDVEECIFKGKDSQKVLDAAAEKMRETLERQKAKYL